MAHLIFENDTALFAEKPAWHGLGIVVEHCPTPEEALKLAKLDWEVGQDRLKRVGTDDLVPTHVVNFRRDNGLQLGVVGAGYQPVQNRELADMAYVVADESGKKVKVESAFSMNKNRRVVFAIRADSFEAMKDDEVKMYLICANGHDGSLALTFYYTSTRVVCNNTFSASRAAAKHTDGYLSFRHEGDMEEKIKQARSVLEAYEKTRREYRGQITKLVERTMTKDEINEFVTGAIVLMERKIPTKEEAADNTRAETKLEKCKEAYRIIGRTLNAEMDKFNAPPSAWLTFNACTRWMQHQREMRGKNKTAAQQNEARALTDMFGTVEEAKAKLWNKALALV